MVSTGGPLCVTPNAGTQWRAPSPSASVKAAVVEPAVVEPAVVEPAVVEPAMVEPAMVMEMVKTMGEENRATDKEQRPIEVRTPPVVWLRVGRQIDRLSR